MEDNPYKSPQSDPTTAGTSNKMRGRDSRWLRVLWGGITVALGLMAFNLAQIIYAGPSHHLYPLVIGIDIVGYCLIATGIGFIFVGLFRG